MEVHTLLADDGTSLTLPVTPMWSIPTGKDYKIVNIAELGEYAIPGYPKLGNIRIPDLLIPSQQYPFCAAFTDPQIVVEWLSRMALERRRLRYVITGAPAAISWPCYLVSFEPGEQDGSGDLHATLVFQQCSSASAPITEKKQTVRRDDPIQETVTTEKNHTVKSGENLWMICRTYYSDGSLAAALAKYNGIKNANIIFAGQVVKIPPKESLDASATVTAASPVVQGPTTKEIETRRGSPLWR